MRSWFEAVSSGFSTADASALRALSTPDCTTCNNYAKAIDDLASKRHIVRGGELEIIFAETADFPGGSAIVDVAYRQKAGQVVDSAGKVVEAYPGKDRVFAQARVDHDGVRWAFRAMRLVTPG